MVWAGRDDGPALVVVDPAGTASHDELPASWDELARRYQVAWCRLPASPRAVDSVEDALETLADQQTPVDLVASGTACELAVALAAQFHHITRRVLLVDPPPDLATAGSRTEVVARSTGGRYDQVRAPLPLGHPDVVDGVTAALLSADAEPV
jgi:pimeloyl-ACP methyl ester carboxylesterase